MEATSSNPPPPVGGYLSDGVSHSVTAVASPWAYTGMAIHYMILSGVVLQQMDAGCHPTDACNSMDPCEHL